MRGCALRLLNSSIFDYEMESSGDTSHFDLCPEFLATADEIGREFIAKTIPKTTQNKRISDFNKFESLLGTNNLEKENLLRMDGKTLNALLMTFIMELKPKEGDFFEPSTYTGIMYSLEAKFKEIGVCYWKIRSSPTYAGLQDVLKAKLAMAKGAGKGNRPNRAEPLSREEEEKMWETGALGTHEPDTLLRTLICGGV